jgi:putative glutamine amidotransferase
MPVIAIAPCEKLHDYQEAIRRAGGEPWVLDQAVDRPEDVIRSANGLLLAGGGDVGPEIYGAAPHPTYHAAEPGRDAYEIELIRRALEADVPVFAICRGIQVLNVARGGTLVQDIPTEVPGALEHKLTVPPHEPFTLAHEVWVEDGSLLARLMGEADGAESRQVNSRHHQAVNTVGEGLVASATAPDGVIEAVEDRTRRFCVGVQWHPENFYRTGEFRALFEGFIKACTI